MILRSVVTPTPSGWVGVGVVKRKFALERRNLRSSCDLRSALSASGSVGNCARAELSGGSRAWAERYREGRDVGPRSARPQEKAGKGASLRLAAKA